MSKTSDLFIKQDPMRRVVYSLVPIFLYSIFLFGWRPVALAAVIFPLGILVEFIMEKGRNKKVSEAVLVTCALFTLSMPPAVPLWVAAVGIVFGVLFGKEVYGGFGRNVFNPAITGRTFVYISFPLMMQTTWMLPGLFGTGGVNHQVLGSTWLEAVFVILVVAAVYLLVTKNPGNSKVIIWTSVLAVAITIAFYIISAYGGIRYFSPEGVAHNGPWQDVDVVTTATPIEIMKGLAQDNNWQQNLIDHGKQSYLYLQDNSLLNLFFGLRLGSLGEGAIFLILIAGIYLLWTKTANWRPMIWTVLSALILTVILYYTGTLGGTVAHPGRFRELMIKPDFAGQLSDILKFTMSGSLLFAAVFMATDPVSAPKKPIPQHLYGIIIGAVTILIRAFAGFPEGVSFAILAANTFASLLDEAFPAKKKAPAPAAKAVTADAKAGDSKAPAAEGGA